LLLSLAKKLFEDQTSLDRMVEKVMLQATELVKCERCTVLLLDTNKEVGIRQQLPWLLGDTLLYSMSHSLMSSVEEGSVAGMKLSVV